MDSEVDTDRLTALQQREVDFWRDSAEESPKSDSIHNIINKMSDVPVFMDVLQRYESVFSRPGSPHILELGGGQGWSTCLIKRLYPSARATLTDISPYAVQSAPKWERMFETKLDAAYACCSYDIPEPEESVDVVYCFAAAHHFRAHRRTLKELHRVLRPGGTALYLYEPTCPQFLHGISYRRVNRIRPEVEEDVLVWRHLIEIASETGLEARVDFHPSTIRRRPVPAIYYAGLSTFRLLCRLLPCTANFVFTKPVQTR